MSVLPDVRILRSDDTVFNHISGMHDCTEGGVLGGVYELCEAAGTGVAIHLDDLPLGNAQKQICRLFHIDPHRSIAAGSLLIVCDKEITEKAVALLQENGITAQKTGQTLPKENNRKVISSKSEEKLVYQEEDPYWKAFFDALEKKLD